MALIWRSLRHTAQLRSAAVHLAVLVVGWRQRYRPLSARGRASLIMSLISLRLLSLGVVSLAWIDNETTHLVWFMPGVSVSVTGLSLGWRASTGKRCGEFDKATMVHRGDNAW